MWTRQSKAGFVSLARRKQSGLLRAGLLELVVPAAFFGALITLRPIVRVRVPATILALMEALMRLGRVLLFSLLLIVLVSLCSCANQASNVSSIVVSAPTTTINSGQSVQLTVTINFYSSGATSSPITYASSSAAIATVDANGNVTGKSQGTAIITATSQGVAGTISITVGPAALRSFSFSTTDFTLALGQNSVLQLSGTLTDGTTATASSFSACTWSSSNLNAITLSTTSTGSSNTLQAKGSGLSTITVTCGTLTPVTTTVTVAAPVIASVAVTPVNPGVSVNSTQQFTATATLTDGTQSDVTASVVWSSSDTSKATITAGGLATGVAAGYTTIKATPTVGTAGSTLLTVASLVPNIALAYPLDSSDSRLAEATVGSDGTLVAVLGSPLTGISGVTVVPNPSGTNLYLGNNTATITGFTSSITNISVDKSTGKLTFPTSRVAPGGFVYSLVTNPNGKFLYGIEKNSASSIQIETFLLDPTTGLPSVATQTPEVLANTFSGSIRATFNSTGSILYVAGRDYFPGTIPPLGTQRIYVFQVDPTTGALTMLQKLGSTGVFNGGMSLDSTGKFLLAGVANSGTSTSSIQVFSADGTGLLPPVSNYGILNASPVAIRGANGYVFAGGIGLGGGNTGLAALSLDGTGNLTQLANITIPATVNDMQVSNDGRYVTVLLNNQLSTYSFDPVAGTLTFVNSLATGGGNFNQMAYIPLN